MNRKDATKVQVLNDVQYTEKYDKWNERNGVELGKLSSKGFGY
jgi:hypothetical protein